MIPNWLRNLGKFTPNYGNCCGKNLDCSGGGEPIDAQDCDCVLHDMDLYGASQIDDPVQRDLAFTAADLLFGMRLRKKKMKDFKRKVYGPIWNRGTRLVFK